MTFFLNCQIREPIKKKTINETELVTNCWGKIKSRHFLSQKVTLGIKKTFLYVSVKKFV